MAQNLLRADREMNETIEAAKLKRVYKYREVYKQVGLGQAVEYLD
ncbi:MAG: hypothetical protein ACYCV0_12220 [Desulfitobacteriaceae bacterium]